MAESKIKSSQEADVVNDLSCGCSDRFQTTETLQVECGNH